MLAIIWFKLDTQIHRNHIRELAQILLIVFPTKHNLVKETKSIKIYIVIPRSHVTLNIIKLKY